MSNCYLFYPQVLPCFLESSPPFFGGHPCIPALQWAQQIDIGRRDEESLCCFIPCPSCPNENFRGFPVEWRQRGQTITTFLS